MKTTIRLCLSLTAALTLSPATFAAPAPVRPGMQHMSVTKDAAPKTDDTTAPAATSAAPNTTQSQSAPVRPALKPLKPEDALKKTESLTEWPYYTDLLTIDNDTAIENVVHNVNIDPGAVPPKGLFFLAKALADRKRYEEAAFYFYAGQLRATFDMARFPPYEENAKRRPTTDKRTDDQKGNVPQASPRLVNPHDDLSVLALTLGAPISRWAMADSARLDPVMARVKSWDLATPYAYLPDYDVSHAVPFKDWPALLSKTRSSYFTRVRQISGGLSKVRAQAPSPTFPRP